MFHICNRDHLQRKDQMMTRTTDTWLCLFRAWVLVWHDEKAPMNMPKYILWLSSKAIWRYNLLVFWNTFHFSSYRLILERHHEDPIPMFSSLAPWCVSDKLDMTLVQVMVCIFCLERCRFPCMASNPKTKIRLHVQPWEGAAFQCGKRLGLDGERVILPLFSPVLALLRWPFKLSNYPYRNNWSLSMYNDPCVLCICVGQHTREYKYVCKSSFRPDNHSFN